MLPIHALAPRFAVRAQRHRRKAVTKRLLPVPTAGESAECIAPAAFCPIGHPAIDDTGISFPVIFCPVSGWSAAKLKDEVLKLPPIPVAAFPPVGKALSPFDRAKPLRFALFLPVKQGRRFCWPLPCWRLVNRPLQLEVCLSKQWRQPAVGACRLLCSTPKR